MPTTYYHTVNGRIRGQSTAGVRTDYLTDALGSVVATVNSSAQVVNTYRYKPYGERLAKTGVGADPRFLWSGNSGSRTDSTAGAERYSRARHFGTMQAQWGAVDRYWPSQPPYAFCKGDPIRWLDPSGHQPIDVIGAIRVFEPVGCGGIVFRTLWNLPKSYSLGDGAIVQEVTIGYREIKCDFSEPKREDYHYLEAWEVFQDARGNLTFKPDPPFDYYYHSPADTCTVGSISWRGKVSFYPGLNIHVAPWKFSSNSHPAGGLPIVEPVPSGFFAQLGGPPRQDHTMDLRWECCHKRPDVHAKARFEDLEVRRDWWGGGELVCRCVQWWLL